MGKPSCDLSHNIITENNVTNNDGGILLCPYTSKNKVYHNNLIGNIDNGYDDGDNYWDNGEEGNYWDDYKEKYPYARPRLQKPWIWNTAYKIKGDGESKDNHPLVDEYNGPHNRRSSPQLNLLTVSMPLNKQAINSLLLRLLQRFPYEFPVLRLLLRM